MSITTFASAPLTSVAPTVFVGCGCAMCLAAGTPAAPTDPEACRVVAAVAIAAADLLGDGRAWTQGQYKTADRRFCLVGAINEAAQRSPVTLDTAPRTALAVQQWVARTLGFGDVFGSLEGWNDTRGRKPGEVIAALRRAAAAAAERAGRVAEAPEDRARARAITDRLVAEREANRRRLWELNNCGDLADYLGEPKAVTYIIGTSAPTTPKAAPRARELVAV